MNSKERVLTTIRHCEPDRVPVGEWGIDHDHVSQILGRHTYWRNRKDTTLALWQSRRNEVVESLKRDCVDLVNALDYDIVTVELVPPKGCKVDDIPRQVAEGKWQDSKGTVYQYAASNDSIIQMTSSPEKYQLTDAELDAICNSAANVDDSEFELVDYVCEKLGDTKAILFRGPESLREYFGDVRRRADPSACHDRHRQGPDKKGRRSIVCQNILFD